MFSILVLLLAITSAYSQVIAPKIKQNDGLEMPIVGLGTWKSGTAVYQAVIDAIEAGYRHIDTSLGYGTEADIGKAIKYLEGQGKIKRSELYITTKLEQDAHAHAKVVPALNKSLANLGMSYVDMYLIHFPVTDSTILDTWLGMEDAQKAGLTKSIGVSNFNEKEVDIVLNGGKIKPATNQVLCNPYKNQAKLLTYLQGKNISLTSYSPLGGDAEIKQLFAETKIINIAKAHNVTAAQVVLRYNIERGTIVIPKSITKAYIIEDISLFGFSLTADEMKSIDSLNRG